MFQEPLSSLILIMAIPGMIMAIPGIPKNSTPVKIMVRTTFKIKHAVRALLLVEPFKNINFQELWPFFFLDKTSFVTHG